MTDIIGKITDPGDFFGARAAKDAGQLSSDLGYQTLGMQRDWMDYIKGAYAPYQQAGLGALSQQVGMLNDIGKPTDYSAIQKGPEFAAAQQAAGGALMANREAMGGMGATSTGNALGANTFNIMNQIANQQKADQMNRFNALGAISGQGMQGSQGVGQFGGNTLSGMAGTMSGIGTGALNSAASQQQANTGLLSAGLGVASLFSDIRLKDDVVFTGDYSNNGYKIYTWEWNKKANEIGLTGSGKGVIADEVEKEDPDAVNVDDNGYKKVNYARV